MKLTNKGIICLTRVFLPSILCALLILYLNSQIEYQFVLIFGLVIVLFNYGKTKYNHGLSLLLSIILSFIVFFFSFGIFLGLGYLIKGGDTEKIVKGLILGIPIGRLHVLSTVSIISPLLMFYSYKVLFRIEPSLYFSFIKWVSIIILFVFGLTDIAYENNYLFIFWEFIMVLALQLILYQKELKILFKSTNE